ncbi:hypothetical protein LTR78_002675 [Recurvomyces mirabilis]|uniref:Histone H1 n=1 Tax=Recurvomyces mirabilis TaxID=574656 RepID=A0AAE1C3W1_9PEZI|nr:hypothetical protein LTR78_002675 [Recurvomyces mirabilis]KAK5159589.1 hypothetical protein LTS14_002731 [Recurvomyces mirabilis]
MPPKKTSTGGAKKAAAASAHASYEDMIKEAIINLKDRSGSSRQALKKYVQANNNLGGVTDASFTSHFNRALQKGSESGTFARPKGPSGPVKLAGPKKDDAAPAATKTTTAKAPAKAKATKTAAAKKAPAKTAAKKTTTAKKAPAKKTAAAKTTKAKANVGKPRKTPAAAPAVEEKAPTVLTKTKTGRVVKTTQPQPAKKAAAKRKAPAKKATPKKAATPKSKA